MALSNPFNQPPNTQIVKDNPTSDSIWRRWFEQLYKRIQTGALGGTVTSVGLSLPTSVFDVTGSPVTSSGTLAATFDTQSANTAFMGPTTGAAATPAFRTLVAADIPSDAPLTIGTTPIVSGTVSRVLYEGSGNLLAESANMTFDGTSFTAQNLLATALLGVNNATPSTYGTAAITTGSSGNAPTIAITEDILSPQLNQYILDSSATLRNLARIQFHTGSSNVVNYQGFLTFWTMSSAGGSISERMRIRANGNILMGTTSDHGGLLNLATGTTAASGIYFGSDMPVFRSAAATLTINGTLVLGAALGVPYGGTGQTSFTNGQLLIGNTTGNTLDKATLTAGTGISITNGAGSITIDSTAAQALKIVYADENLTVDTNTQVTGHASLTFTGTGSLIVNGTGSLAIL